MADVEAELARRLERGEEVVLATVIRLDGEPPSRSGAKALFTRSRQLAGTLGCSEFDSQARVEAARLLDAGSPGLRTFRHDLGSIEVYLEPYPSRPLLVVLADTPVAEALRRCAPEVGFEVANEVPSDPVPLPHDDAAGVPSFGPPPGGRRPPGRDRPLHQPHGGGPGRPGEAPGADEPERARRRHRGRIPAGAGRTIRSLGRRGDAGAG